MAFFDEARREPPPRTVVRPVWAGPQPGVLPGYSNQSAFVFHTDAGALAVHGFEVYPNGIQFKVSFWEREPDPYAHDSPFDSPIGRHGRVDESFVRFGVQFDDGSRWTNLDSSVWAGDAPAAPFVTQQGGGGGGGDWTFRHWIWPIPDGSSLTFVGAWPKFNVPESTVSLNLDEMRSRLVDVKAVWD